ncbi:MAG: hypothetical protein WC373_14865 [Smithella sp.]|jgi:hypothetical protein
MIICDIKTGKAEPWAALQTAAQSLLCCYDVAFKKEGHVYTSNGKTYPSITQILSAEGFIDTTWFDEWSRDKGSMVHLACHYDVTGELDEESLDPEIVPYLAAFRRFMNESGFKVDKSEVPAINKTYGYAGTPDLIGCFPKPTAARRFALELTKEGKYHLIPYTNQQDFSIWLTAVAVFHWKNNNSKRR